MVTQRFALVADVSSVDLGAIEPLLRQLVGGEISATAGGFHVAATLTGESARDLNRSLLSALRRAERRTRLRGDVEGRRDHRALLRLHPEGPAVRDAAAASAMTRSWCARPALRAWLDPQLRRMPAISRSSSWSAWRRGSQSSAG